MPSTFNVKQAAGYEQLMGRWSRLLASPFIAFAGISDGERILDVGCGTGSLTFALAQRPTLTEIAAVDISPVFVEEVQRRSKDARINVQQADACALPFEEHRFDRALALLVLHFIPEPQKAVAEMRRVTRPGGTVAAAVWDHLGGLPAMRMIWDSISSTSEKARAAAGRYFWQPMMQPDEMKQCFLAAGLRDVEQQSLLIRMNYQSFEDYWTPLAAGEGPIGRYISTLDPAERAELESSVRLAYESGRPDGPRSFAAVAWACRGTAP
jgi:ubiquinone/menaquinone biosynthesis C-methylase UbiE